MCIVFITMSKEMCNLPYKQLCIAAKAKTSNNQLKKSEDPLNGRNELFNVVKNILANYSMLIFSNCSMLVVQCNSCYFLKLHCISFDYLGVFTEFYRSKHVKVLSHKFYIQKLISCLFFQFF